MSSEVCTQIQHPKLTGYALVVDDHPLFCDALEITLRSVSEFSDIVTAGSLSEALAKIENGPNPALILLDLNLPDVNGLDGLIRLLRSADLCLQYPGPFGD